MKNRLTVIIHLFLVCSLFLLSACQNRTRPNPDDTRGAFGLGPGGLAAGSSMDASYSPETLEGAGWGGTTGLQDRSATGAYGPDNQVRGLLEPIYFAFDRSVITAEERPKAQAAADHLRNNPGDSLLIEGHCDWRGTTEYNLGLGDRRATSVKDYLVSLGISASRLEVLSKGDLEAVQGGTEAEMAHDRRAELIVIRP